MSCWCGDPGEPIPGTWGRWRLCWRGHDYYVPPSPYGVTAEDFADALVRTFATGGPVSGGCAVVGDMGPEWVRPIPTEATS